MKLMMIGLLFSFSLSAALPPRFQKAREIRRILTDKNVATKLGGAPISATRDPKSKGVVYNVESLNCKGMVKVIYWGKGCKRPPRGWVGPTCFNLEILPVVACSKKPLCNSVAKKEGICK